MGYTGISKKIILYNSLNLYNDLAKFCKHTRSGDSVEAGTRERLEIAIRARELADIYEKNGFEGLYAEGTIYPSKKRGDKQWSRKGN